MHASRLSLAGVVMLALLGGMGGVVLAEDQEAAEVNAQALSDMAAEGWTNDVAALLEQAYAPDAVHKAVYFDGVHEDVGREALIANAMGPLTITPVAPVVELDAPDGELHWIEISDVIGPDFLGTDTVCSFWARDGQIYRHDCLVSMECPAGFCAP